MAKINKMGYVASFGKKFLEFCASITVLEKIATLGLYCRALSKAIMIAIEMLLVHT